jgi:hypothetical protein
MYFAFFYLIFFALDIFIVSNLKSVGMVPMHFLIGGVGFFFCFYVGKRFSIFNHHTKYSIIHILSFALIVLVSVFNLFAAISMSIKIFQVFMVRIGFIPEWVFSVFSGLLSLLIVFLIPLKSSLSRWMLYSAVTCFIRYCIPLVIGLPELLYRYMGVFDLIMLFGWLMIIITLLRLEYGFDLSVNQNIAVR